MPVPMGPAPRVPNLPIAQMLQKQPVVIPPSKDAYGQKAKDGDKGGLPIEICAFAQTLYQQPQMQPTPPNPNMQPQPGWGGKGR